MNILVRILLILSILTLFLLAFVPTLNQQVINPTPHPTGLNPTGLNPTGLNPTGLNPTGTPPLPGGVILDPPGYLKDTYLPFVISER